MGLLSIFKRSIDAAPASVVNDGGDAVQQARTRARRRLIGAIVLLVIGVIGFPLVFETKPRPVPVDIPIEIPRPDNVPPLVMPPRQAPIAAAPTTSVAPPASTAAEVITESRADAGRDVAARATDAGSSSAAPAPAAGPASRAAAPVAESTRKVAAAPPAEPTQSAKAVAPAPANAARPNGGSTAVAEAARSKPSIETKPSAAAEAGRFVVQVGAFSEAESARDTRMKAEKLGLKTYTQVAQTPAGNRIRVRIGPFANRAEADAALAKARSAGLTAVVLTL